MFSNSDHDFMTENMKISVETLEEKLNEPFFSEFKDIAVDAISKYIDAIKNYEASGVPRDLFSGRDNEAEETIRKHYCEISDGIDRIEIIEVMDALRHSFSCYAYNGLHQLYTRQENECWHPKICLTDVLEPNDIEALPQTITLYRGCDASEFECNSFGQAWTTSLEMAENFAYRTYRSQPWFDVTNRAVLEVSYCKDDVLFSDQSIEYEVVVDVQKLTGVRRRT
ncbi:hypothetical protein HNQ57_000900 [Zhongshania antarctica]|uniref:Uncharacterized protein n=1 Tax=Zhongshania antarctica TaxID=641702 RepID=A0A840R0M0_9GAMM|nr:hypothetical protein [Zhongshania antarctica]MBB5186639.1 hypothetical protein [Zhongshania antarctica]